MGSSFPSIATFLIHHIICETHLKALIWERARRD
jgi:hypothetical protein